MADLPSEFWGGYIVVLTLVSLAGAVWLLFSVYFSPSSAADHPREVWDETLREGFNPAPLWWFWLTIALLAVSVIYLILYPGLGTFSGVVRWSQGGELNAKLQQYESRFGARRSAIATTPLAELQRDESAMNTAWRIFNVNCSPCHGVDAKGQANLFPDLSDAVWQWGGGEAQIEQTISLGRQGVMPPWQAVLGDEGVTAMADYVIALSLGQSGDPRFAAAAASFNTYCSACHANDGTGNPLLGATSLADSAWVYGGTEAAIAESIRSGRTGIMPGFSGRLDTTQIRLLTAWLEDGAVPRP